MRFFIFPSSPINYLEIPWGNHCLMPWHQTWHQQNNNSNVTCMLQDLNIFLVCQLTCFFSFHLFHRPFFLTLGFLGLRIRFTFLFYFQTLVIWDLQSPLVDQGSSRDNCQHPPSPSKPKYIKFIVPVSSTRPNRGYPVGCVSVHFPWGEYKQWQLLLSCRIGWKGNTVFQLLLCHIGQVEGLFINACSSVAVTISPVSSHSQSSISAMAADITL